MSFQRCKGCFEHQQLTVKQPNRSISMHDVSSIGEQGRWPLLQQTVLAMKPKFLKYYEDILLVFFLFLGIHSLRFKVQVGGVQNFLIPYYENYGLYEEVQIKWILVWGIDFGICMLPILVDLSQRVPPHEQRWCLRRTVLKTLCGLGSLRRTYTQTSACSVLI